MRIVWAVPAIVCVLAVLADQHLNSSIPAPFLLMLVSVMIAGAMGGRSPGTVAGVTAASYVVHAYATQYGPPTLTGGVVQTTIGCALYIATGVLLGILRDQRDSSIETLEQKKYELESSLHEKLVENAQKAIRIAESEARLQQAVKIAGVGYFVYNTTSDVCEFCSEEHAAQHGMTPEQYIQTVSGLEGEMSLTHPDDREYVRENYRKLRSGKPINIEFRVLDSKGNIRHVREIAEPIFDDAGNVVKEFGASFDITDLREAEQRLRQTQRIEAIGQLTGGVAHDFNNLLAVILGNLELCLDEKQKADSEKFIKSAIAATLRGADLTKSLLSFSRRAHLEPKRVNLNDLVQDTMAWCARVLPETIDLEHSMMAGLWDTDLDTTSAENALINILLNARDAMPEGGKVTIETTNMRIGEEYVAERGEDIEPGRFVMLAISDTGDGIPADQIDKIVEPFYTTKAVGKGSGLGLSMVHGFIKQSGGAIRIYSEVGVGTTIKLYFKAAEPGRERVSVEPSQTPWSANGTVRILVAEDEEEVMKVLKAVLEGVGYSVVTAINGDSALKIFKSDANFDLLLTDVVMPGELQGPALAKAIRAINPDLPCIFVSGYASEATVHGNGLRPSDIRLMKPVGRDDLLRAVSNALNVKL
jgi:PAS domain S-box-containing protein